MGVMEVSLSEDNDTFLELFPWEYEAWRSSPWEFLISLANIAPAKHAATPVHGACWARSSVKMRVAFISIGILLIEKDLRSKSAEMNLSNHAHAREISILVKTKLTSGTPTFWVWKESIPGTDERFGVQTSIYLSGCARPESVFPSHAAEF
jgi:hypothetical protein